MSILPPEHHPAGRATGGVHKQLSRASVLQAMIGQNELGMSAAPGVPEVLASDGEGRDIYSI
jgi:hypothetical protein